MYVKVTNGSGVRYTLAQLRSDNPTVGFPPRPSDALLATYDVFPVTEDAPIPVPNEAAQKRVLDTVPTKRGQSWHLGWSIVERSNEEKDEYNRGVDRAALATDTAVNALLKARPNQIDTFIDANVSDMADVRDILKRLSRAVSVLAQSIEA